jgi:hypothetical protein
LQSLSGSNMQVGLNSLFKSFLGYSQMTAWVLTLILSGAVYAEDLLPDERRAKSRDLLYGQALYSLHAGEYDKALSLNNAIRKRGQKGYGKVLDIHQATAQLGLGMSTSATKQFERLISDQRISFLPPAARSQSWFYLAKHFYTRGMWPQSLKAIRKVQSINLNPTLKDEYHFLASTLELFNGNSNNADKHILAINKKSKWAAYAVLNLAVSYTEKDVHISKVEAVFEEALRLTQYTETPSELTDRIHLMAGQFFFATGRGRSAIRHLNSVGLDSAYTPKALLTFGWALTEQWQYHDALQPWYMLKTAHSQLNQDVQETLIAIPYLLEKLNAKVMALGAFDYATEQYDEIYSKLEKSATRLNSGKFIEPLLAQQIPDRWGAFIPIDLSLPDHPDKVYLKDVMSHGYFQGELKSLRDLHVMRYKLNEAIEQLDAFAITANTRKQEFNEVKQEKLVTLHSNQLAKLKARYNNLNKRVKKAFNNPSGNGLASDQEKDQLASFKQLAEFIAVLANKKSINKDDYEQRLRRIDGVLSWDLSQRYHKRKQQVAKTLAILKASIQTASKQLDAASFAYQVAPNSYQGFNKKISRLKTKYQNQLSKLDFVYSKQREKVGSIVKADIKTRQQRVMNYQLQARLAAARLFDETSNKVRVIANAEVKQ